MRIPTPNKAGLDYRNFFLAVCLGCAGTFFPPAWQTALAEEAHALAPGTLIWQFQMGDTADILGQIPPSPALAQDGTVYVDSPADYIFALNANGTLKWSQYIYGAFASSPAVATNGTIYVGADQLYAFSPAGVPDWSANINWPHYSGPAIGKHDTIYIGSWAQGYLYAISPTNTLLWAYPVGIGVDSAPAIGDDGTIYFTAQQLGLYALNPDGSLKWRFCEECGEVYYYTPCIGPDGTIYVGADQVGLSALNPQDGSVKWQYPFTNTNGVLSISGIAYAPAVGPGGVIYVGGNDELCSFNSDGTLNWQGPAPCLNFTPAIDANGTVYAVSHNCLYAVNPVDGAIKWQFKGTNFDQVFSAPTLGSDGTIYISSDAGWVYAIAGEGVGPALASWPMFHHDARHTGLHTPLQYADLALTGLSVTPGTIATEPTQSSPQFTACNFKLVNHGPAALSAATVSVAYYLSTNTVFGDADGIQIGNTAFYNVSIASGATDSIGLSTTGLGNMVRFWPTNVPAGNYYLFARCSIAGGSVVDPNATNDYSRTASAIGYRLPQYADLALTGLSVTPGTIATEPTQSSPQFTACNFKLVNHGPAALSAATVSVAYSLSTNTVFGDADDIQIGNTAFYSVSIASGATDSIGLSTTGLGNMVRFWPTNVPAGNYYLFARCSIAGGSVVDPNATNDYSRTASAIGYRLPQYADLALTGLSVTPGTIATKPTQSSPQFTACNFKLVNHGPAALSAATVSVAYSLSTNTVFGDADDIQIGNTAFYNVSIASGATDSIGLSTTGLGNMVRFWPTNVPAGNYYLFARCSIAGGSVVDPNATNDYSRTASAIGYR